MSDRSPVRLKVLTFNLRYADAADGPNAWTNRREAVKQVLIDHDPDLVLLQEALAVQVETVCEALPGHLAVGSGRNDGRDDGEFVPILIRARRFRLETARTFWLSDTPDQPGTISRSWGNHLPRIGVEVRLVDRLGGRRWVVGNLHLDHDSAEARRRGLDLAVDRLTAAAVASGDPRVLLLMGGDFNAPTEDNTLRRHLGEGFIDLVTAADPSLAAVGTRHDFLGQGGPRIDHLWLRGGEFTPIAAGIDTRPMLERMPSDHHPVWAVVETTR
jgi:endonuclease/exonuclease/phosphatase family metal-dependent hydrolase